MKFGETITEYLHGDQEWFLHKCSHVEYKRLKKVLKSCRAFRAVDDENAEDENLQNSKTCDCDSCPSCDQKFFTELTKDALEVVGCFSSRVRRLLNLHANSGPLNLIWRLRQCFTDDQQNLIQEGRMLLDYVTMNAIAIRKILKKYDKVHGSVTGRNFKTKLHAEHIELLQSPWLIELGAFYINCSGSDMGEPGEFFRQLSCDLSDDQPVITITLSDSIKYEYSLTCAVCSGPAQAQDGQDKCLGHRIGKGQQNNFHVFQFVPLSPPTPIQSPTPRHCCTVQADLASNSTSSPTTLP